MAELLGRIRAEIGARLDESRAAVDEYERLEAALAALGGPIKARRLKPSSPGPAEEAIPDAAPPEPIAEPAAEATEPEAPAEAPSLRAVAAPAADEPPDEAAA
jgi:hypothetical protein